MFRSCVELQWVKRILVAGVLSVALASCGGGGGGGTGTPIGGGGTPTGPSSTSPYAQPSATALTMTNMSVTFPSSGHIYPVVDFKVTNENNAGFTGLNGTKSDGTLLDNLRFNIAKLTPGVGGPSKWQNYVNAVKQNAVTGVNAVVGSTEKPKVYVRSDEHSPDAGKPGVLVDKGDGNYTYTYYTDISASSATCPLASAVQCKDADGTALDLVYDPLLTHRVGIYIQGPLPAVNGIKDIRPSNGAQVGLDSREIVATAKCNECHNKLKVHGQSGRIDTRLCVTCHNPGSWVANDDGTSTSVDFKVYIHKIHRGSSLPSVVGSVPGSIKKPYMIGTDDFSDVVFPQEIRNCTKCHDGTPGAPNATSEGDNWKSVTGLSRAACGSCHDNINFKVDGGQSTYNTTSIDKRTLHSGGVMPNDSTCKTCHTEGQYARSVAADHNNTEGNSTEASKFAATVARDKFQFKIISICGQTAPVSLADPQPTCDPGQIAPGQIPVIKFAVIDPSLGGTLHGYSTSSYGNAYKLFADPASLAAADVEFWNTAGSSANGSMSIDIAWDTRDYNNKGGFSARPSRADQVSVFGGSATTNYGFVTSPATTQLLASPKAKDNGDGSYTIASRGPIPADAVGSGAVAIEGRATADPLTTVPATIARLRVPIKGEVKYFSITDAVPVARRVAVDAATKCDNCHDQLSLHGGSRNDNVQLCVICHNPNNTDVSASARHKLANGLSDASVTAVTHTPPYPVDGKDEESIDFKRMIHGIHAGAATSLDGSTTLSGFRTKGIAVSGNDYSDVRFPGILNDCTTCHVNNTAGTAGSYELTGIWAAPTQNNILASTVDSTPGLTASNTLTEVNNSLQDPGDDYNISATAAVCSSCHDSDAWKTHMRQNGAVFSDDASNSTQANINTNAGTPQGESCPLCHGKGAAAADVKVVHNVP